MKCAASTSVSAQDFYKHHYAPNNAILIAGRRCDGRSGAGAWRNPNMARSPPAICSRAPNSPNRRGMAETRMTVVRADAQVFRCSSGIYRVPSYAQAGPGRGGKFRNPGPDHGRRPDRRAVSHPGRGQKKLASPTPAVPMTAMPAMPANFPSMPCRGRGVSAGNSWKKPSTR